MYHYKTYDGTAAHESTAFINKISRIRTEVPKYVPNFLKYGVLTFSTNDYCICRLYSHPTWLRNLPEYYFEILGNVCVCEGDFILTVNTVTESLGLR